MFVSLAAGTARRGSAAAPIEDTLASIENVTGGRATTRSPATAGQRPRRPGRQRHAHRRRRQRYADRRRRATTRSTATAASIPPPMPARSTPCSSAWPPARPGAARRRRRSRIRSTRSRTSPAVPATTRSPPTAVPDAWTAGPATTRSAAAPATTPSMAAPADDTFAYTIGDGADAVDGGTRLRHLAIVGTAGADTLDVIFDGSGHHRLRRRHGDERRDGQRQPAGRHRHADLCRLDRRSHGEPGRRNAHRASLRSPASRTSSAAPATTRPDRRQTLNGGAGNDTLDGGPATTLVAARRRHLHRQPRAIPSPRPPTAPAASIRCSPPATRSRWRPTSRT